MPNLNYLDPYPRGWSNPVTARASAILTAAWDVAPTEFFCSGAEWMRLQFTYTRGAAGGAFDFQIESSIYSVAALVPAGAGAWADPTVEAVGAVVAGADTQSLIQDGYDTFESGGAAAETATYGPVQLNKTLERIRIPCRESADGVVGSPGTLQVTAELW